MTDESFSPNRETVSKQRPPIEADIMWRAVQIARLWHDRLITVDIDGKTAAELTDEQALIVGFALFVGDWRGFMETPKLNRCGWCVLANGGDSNAVPRLTVAEVREHTLTCEHNPLVVENQRLRADNATTHDRLLRAFQRIDYLESLAGEGTA